jgi:PKD repeat protein
MKSHFPLVVSVFLCLIIVSLVSANDFTERALNGQFDQVTITNEQWIAEQEMSFPPGPPGWSLTDEGEPTPYWEPDDWNDEESDLHATVYLTHDGEGAGALTTLDATGGQYVKIVLGSAGNEEVAVYLDDVLLGTVAGEGATAQFDISGSEWTTSSVLKFIANGDRWTSSLVRSISLMASTHSGTPVAAFNGTPLSGMVPLEIFFTDESTGSPTSWFWDFGDGNPSTQQNPHHTFIAAGTYTVQLTVTNSAGNNTITKTGYIIVSEPAEMTIEIRDTDTSDPIPNAGVGLYDYNASEWQNLTTLSGTIIFRDSGSTHQYPLVIGNIYQVAASADEYSPVTRDITFMQNGQQEVVNLTKVEKPEPVIHTYSMTNVELYRKTTENLAVPSVNYYPGTGIYVNMSRILNNEGWQSSGLYHNDTSVTKEDFGTLGGGLNNATFHYHFGHGNYSQALEFYEYRLETDGTTPNPEQPYLKYSIHYLELDKTWGNKNKWVLIDACSVLENNRWGQALGTSHGILGFASTKNPSQDLPNLFFKYALDENQTVLRSYKQATFESFTKNVTAAAIFDNDDQWDRDHFPGHGEVAPDETPNDIPVRYETWPCGGGPTDNSFYN